MAEHPIIQAVQEDNVDTVKAFLIENPELVHVRTLYGGSLLCCTDDLEMTKLLLENGTDVNHQNDNGETVFHFPGNENPLVSLYLRYGANPYVRDNEGDKPEIVCWESSDELWADNPMHVYQQWTWIKSVTSLVTLLSINERRRLGGKVVLQTELFRYLQVFLTNKI